jgi:hypothetical protein
MNVSARTCSAETGDSAQLHRLVEEAVAIARSHPDPYLQHSVEHQVRS